MVISDEQVLYPYISAPSVLVAMSQEAYNKYYTKNRHNALVIVDEDLVKPREVNSGKILTVPATRMAEELGRTTVANVVMLGFFTAATSLVSMEAMRKSVLASAPKGTEELNMNAIERGYTYSLEKLGLVQ